jgi:predicted  nucleic acid-binding Zn-ribbon protein
MTDLEWVQKELARYEQEETEAQDRLIKAREGCIRAKKELAAAKESLAGIQGAKDEFKYQLEYVKEHGKLP